MRRLGERALTILDEIIFNRAGSFVARLSFIVELTRFFSPTPMTFFQGSCSVRSIVFVWDCFEFWLFWEVKASPSCDSFESRNKLNFGEWNETEGV